MKNLQFDTRIDRPAQRVWNILWGPATYNQWTKFFSPGSRIETDWQPGGRTVFLDDKGNGMVSTIVAVHQPSEVIFRHVGMIEDGIEYRTGDKVKNWAGALEKYHLQEQDGRTTLTVSVDVNEEYAERMTDAFIKGLAVVKELSEK